MTSYCTSWRILSIYTLMVFDGYHILTTFTVEVLHHELIAYLTIHILSWSTKNITNLCSSQGFEPRTTVWTWDLDSMIYSGLIPKVDYVISDLICYFYRNMVSNSNCGLWFKTLRWLNICEALRWLWKDVYGEVQNGFVIQHHSMRGY